MSVSGPFKLIFQTGTIFENRLIIGQGTRTKFRLFTLLINYSTKPGHRCLVVHLGTCLVAISLIGSCYNMVPFLIEVFFVQNGRQRSRDLIYILFYSKSYKLLRFIILLKFCRYRPKSSKYRPPLDFLREIEKTPMP